MQLLVLIAAKAEGLTSDWVLDMITDCGKAFLSDKIVLENLLRHFAGFTKETQGSILAESKSTELRQKFLEVLALEQIISLAFSLTD